MPSPIKIFYSYAHEDEHWRDELEKHLSTLQQQQLISGWHDRKITGGKVWAHEIVTNIQNADIILLLISPDFLASSYCSQTEVPLAMQRHTAGQARVIPIILRPIDWKGAPFDQLQALPTDGQPVATSPHIDQAFYTVAQGIRTVVEELTNNPLPSSSKTTRIWNIPFGRNPYFTGRETILTHLHTILTTNSTAALSQPQAISGLGGIGKTQTALEYAYRYRDNYRYILWARADTPETLASDFVSIAHLLNLPEKEAQEQPLVIAAVKRWLENNPDWLLILDNADDLQMAHDFLPPNGKGHILLTTRSYSTGGIAQRVEIEEMQPVQGALFLLRRAGMIGPDAPLSTASEADSSKAQEISKAMDGLPLALDQAAAFIEETACSLTDYLAIYHKQRAELLKQRGGIAAPHPEPVATTWSLSFQKVEQAHPAAAELLRLCAFLHPDAIPEELLTKGASELGTILQPVATNPIQLNKALAELLKYSLVRRDAKAKTLTVHRLVQAVLKDTMTTLVQRQWAERVVKAVDIAIPLVKQWRLLEYERFIPQLLTALNLIKDYHLSLIQGLSLLHTLVRYYGYDRVLHNELNCLALAESTFEYSLRIYEPILHNTEQTLGVEHPNIIIILHTLALAYQGLSLTQGRLNKYEEAEQLYLRALRISEQKLGSEHLETAITLHELAKLYSVEGKNSKAEPLYQRAIAIREKNLGPTHPELANWLNNLANLYREQGKYAQAEPLYQQAMAIDEKTLGATHPGLALHLENYASLLRKTHREAEAAKLEARAKAIRAKHAQQNSPNSKV